MYSIREVDYLKLESSERAKFNIPPWKSIAVACGSFLNIFISIGCPYSLGVLYDDLMYTFNVGRIDVTMVIALCTGILSAAGALVGIIINKCGLRMTLLIGGLLGSCGTFVSGFATGIPFLIVTLGIVTGLAYPGLVTTCEKTI